MLMEHGSNFPVPAAAAPFALGKRPDDRRGTHRFRTVCRIAKVARGAVLGLWRVRNISDKGMMLATGAAMAPGDRLTVALSETHSQPARVVWCEDGQCGVAFDTPIDSASLLRSLVAEQKDDHYRAPRLPVDIPALAYSEDGIHSVRICDMSQQGIGFTHHGRFRPGMRIKLLLENGLERRGIVRWSHDDQAGLSLVEPFDCTALESAGRLVDGRA